MLKINNRFYSILLRILLNSTSNFTQFWFGFYSILVRNLLNSASEFTQFYFGFYSIWAVKVLNSFCPSKCFRDAVLKTRVSSKALRKRSVEEMRCAHDPSPAEPARVDSGGRVLFEETAENG